MEFEAYAEKCTMCTYSSSADEFSGLTRKLRLGGSMEFYEPFFGETATPNGIVFFTYFVCLIVSPFHDLTALATDK